ncbi:MAG TPA: VCBS repeat-containing protein [Pirellulales bacterium]|nr:VCBS repeat-containing protein [Pirellulales bacterium]
MASILLKRAVFGAIVLAVIAAAAASAVIVLRPWWKEVAGDRPPGFLDKTEASGIHFQMGFLPGEQGEAFRINLYDHGSGVAVADYDGDGHDDILLLNQLGSNALFRNRGDGTFEDVTEQTGPLALADRICVGAAFADYDNDGDQDLYITSTRGGNVLFRNDGQGHLADITEVAGVDCVAHSQTPVFFDYDNDGWLDLLVTNTANWTTEEFDEEARYYRGRDFSWAIIYEVAIREKNVLYRNRGDGTFDEVPDAAGLAGLGWSGDVAVFDYDDDGAVDVFITNMLGKSQLYHNDGQGHFDDVTDMTLAPTSFGAVGCAAFDYNNDARLDLFVADMHSDMWVGQDSPWSVEPQQKFKHRTGPDRALNPKLYRLERAEAERLGMDEKQFLYGNTFYRNEGQGRFTEVSGAAVSLPGTEKCEHRQTPITRQRKAKQRKAII